MKKILNNLNILVMIKDKNIDFNEYIGTWILWIYRKYIDGYFYINIGKA